MYFSEITKPNGSFKGPPNEDTYKLHQFVWSLFDPDDHTRDFIYSLYNRKIYIVSAKKPENSSTEEVTIKTHNYDPKFSKGQVLRFDVRLNAEARRDKRVSIVTAQRIDAGDDYDENWNGLIYEAAHKWLSYNSPKHGFKVRDFRVLNFHRYDFKNAKEEPVKFISLDLQGVLEVIGPEVFVYTLHKGIGHTRCHGCGLMLVAP
jgi:CRISPR-associated protein Cas6/Cse3/CasE subtype I-E